MRITDIPKEHREVYLSNAISDSIKEIIEYHNNDNADKIIEVVIKSDKLIELLYVCGYLDDDDLDLVTKAIIKTI